MSDVEKHFAQEEKIVATEHLERVSSSVDGDGHVKLPSRMFTPEEEKKLYRKVDLRIMPILSRTSSLAESLALQDSSAYVPPLASQCSPCSRSWTGVLLSLDDWVE
jgi:hypothetical protein